MDFIIFVCVILALFSLKFVSLLAPNPGALLGPVKHVAHFVDDRPSDLRHKSGIRLSCNNNNNTFCRDGPCQLDKVFRKALMCDYRRN